MRHFYLIHLRYRSRILHIVVPIIRDGQRSSAVFVYLQCEGVVDFGIENSVKRHNPSIVSLHRFLILHILGSGV